MKKSVLVTLADKNYINQAKQLFSSVYFNSGWQGDYLLLSHDIPEKDLKWFRKKGIIVKKVKPLIYKKFNQWGPSIYSKFYLFSPYFKKWKNVVYLDSDIIVKYSIENLANLKGFYATTYKDKKLYHEIFKFNRELDKLKGKYSDLKGLVFNSGVMAFSSDIIKENTFIDLKNIFHKYVYITDGEEPLLNLYFQGIWNRLPIIYNFPVVLSNKVVEAIFGESVVQHFVSSKKPWKKDSSFYREWKDNLEKADRIDLDNRIKGNLLSTRKKLNYSIFLRFLVIYCIIDKKIGQIGIILRNYSPKIYYILKRIK
ncbi:MAG TPA: glycosyltransferase [Candidatus Nanoarchaeia archaeon]|nr:glycosyltransferase [Candidatus Nanoarchaeia archaeon]